MAVVLRLPGVLRAFAGSCLAQLPMGALGLLFVLHTRDVAGGYAAGGAVAAAYAVALGVSNPVLARVADRRGQVRLLQVGSVISGSAIVAQAFLPDGAPLATRIVLAGVAGAAQPPVGAFRRRLWAVLVVDDDLRHRAYATEGVLLEIVYILGPVAIVGGIGTWSTVAALLTCAAAVVVGDLAFARHPAVRALEGDPPAGRDLGGALRAPGVVVALLAMLTLGVSVGGAEVAVPAALERMGDRSLTGVVLGLWGLGSMLGGVAVARLRAPARPERRLAALVAAWGALHGLVAFAATPAELAVGFLVAGATIAPTFTVLNGLLDRVALPGTLTEAFTWTSTGMVVGVGIGGALAGRVSDAVSPAAALALGAVGLLGAAVLVAARGVLVQPAVAAA